MASGRPVVAAVQSLGSRLLALTDSLFPGVHRTEHCMQPAAHVSPLIVSSRGTDPALFASSSHVPKTADNPPGVRTDHSSRCPPHVCLRPPTLGDAPSMHQLVLDTGLDENSPYAYIVFADHFSSQCVIAEDQGGRVVGMVVAYRPPSHEDTVFVWQVCTHPSVHGSGIGVAMLHDLVDRLRPDGVVFLEATVTPDNAASRRLFAKFGEQTGGDVVVTPSYFSADQFPAGSGHLGEDLFRIGPL